MLDLLLSAALILTGAPVAAAALYLAALALLSRRPAPVTHPVTAHRFDLVVPAHDEEEGIVATVASLLALDWPAGQRRVLVVADNCTDATAERARQAGAVVLVRHDPNLRGKGYALALAFERVLADGLADAAVVVDADTLVSPGLLRGLAARLGAGAQAVQACYGVRNPGDSWRTRLMAVAFALVHDLRSQGRERLGLSAGLRGNGMCFTTRLMREVPHTAFSIVEDLEYGLRLGQAGHRVHFAGEVSVQGDMPAGAGAGASQRQRWEAGRRAMARTHGWPMLRRGLAARDPVLVDLALDLLVPPLARLGALAVAGSAAAAALVALRPALLWSAWAWWISLPALLVYLFRGWQLSGTGLAGLTALAHAPAYLLWKVLLARRPSPGGAWVRTQREEKRP